MRGALIASPAGTAIAVASVAESERQPQAVLERLHEVRMREHRLEPAQREARWSGCVSVFSGVNATTQTISSGASMNADHERVESEGEGPFFCMASPKRLVVARASTTRL